MDKKNISEATAKTIVLDKIRDDLQNDIEVVDCPNHEGSLAYALNGCDPVNFYFFHINPPKHAVGASRIICISKESGDVVFDGYVGE